jgi:hypothetical protein
MTLMMAQWAGEGMRQHQQLKQQIYIKVEEWLKECDE